MYCMRKFSPSVKSISKRGQDQVREFDVVLKKLENFSKVLYILLSTSQHTTLGLAGNSSKILLIIYFFLSLQKRWDLRTVLDVHQLGSCHA